MTKHDEALEVLRTARRRLLARLAEAVIGSKDALLDEGGDGHDPLTCNHDLDKMTAGLIRLDAAITGLQRLAAGHDDQQATHSQPSESRRQSQRSNIFDRYVELVAHQRLEEASRELTRILQMPLDQMITATRFFARALRVDPTIAGRLSELPARCGNASGSQCMGLLVKTFGFQAVESRMAIQALQERMRQTGTPEGNQATAVDTAVASHTGFGAM